MKNSLIILSAIAVNASLATAQSDGSHLNILRQVQLESGFQMDVQVPDEGSQASTLEVPQNGSQLELWTIVDGVVVGSYLLDYKVVGEVTPVADIRIATEDPYEAIPRTRVGQPFNLVVSTAGMNESNDPEVHDAMKMVTYERRVQSYGIKGTGENIDRSVPEYGTLIAQENMVGNDNFLRQYSAPFIAGGFDPAYRGEETFSIYSLDHHDGDYNIASELISTLRMQVWPLARVAIEGITEGQEVRFDTPSITVTLEDLYPDSITTGRLYPGPVSSDATPRFIPEAKSMFPNRAVPSDDVWTLDTRWDTMIDRDGDWTFEVVSITPFNGGVGERLAHVTFKVNRGIEIQSSLTTSE